MYFSGNGVESFQLFPYLLFQVKNNILAPLSFTGLCVLFPPKQLSLLQRIFFPSRLESAGNSIVRYRNRDRMVTMALCKISALTHSRVGHTAANRVSDCGF